MIEMSFVDDQGVTRLRDYFFFTEASMGVEGWYNEDYEFVGDTEGINNGQGAWFVSTTPKQITQAGQIYAGNNGNFVHTFDETSVLTSSAFPVSFCPNSANVTWVGFADEDMLETSFTDDQGVTRLRDYFYFTEASMGVEGWYNEDYELLDADTSIVAPGAGFWVVIGDTASTFTEASPVK